MEKLLDLLQEFYGEDRKFINENGLLTMTNGVVNLSGAYAQTYIISKQGGFIKWLVENGKIHNERIDKVVEDCGLEQGEYYCKCYGVYESLLMLLSIQDEPIEFLVSILK